MGESCVICKQDMKQVTPLHVQHKHNMTWEEYQKAKNDPEFLAQVEKSAMERAKRTEGENYARQILLNYWFSPLLLSSMMKNFKEHNTIDRTMFTPPPIDLKKFDGMKIVETGSLSEAEALVKSGKWIAVTARGGIQEIEDENGVVKTIRRPKIYELRRKEG